MPISTGGGNLIFMPGGYGFYPWGYTGLGFGGYYGGYYYDSWYTSTGYSTYYPAYSTQSGADEGGLRLKVTPRDALVYEDGYYVGRVEDFNGVLQRLHLSSGPHRIEIRFEPQYEPLMFDVRIEAGKTVTYRGELEKVH